LVGVALLLLLGITQILLSFRPHGMHALPSDGSPPHRKGMPGRERCGVTYPVSGCWPCFPFWWRRSPSRFRFA
jgi:hypothetical protein